ncbi:MBL fold metallo-hydrolase [Streptomyces sp. NPDC054837]
MEISYVGGPTAVLSLGGSRALVKTTGPALTAADLGPVDAVLLSHDRHPDNLDAAGHAYLAGVPLALSTASAHDRLGAPVRALPAWESVEVDGARVTAVPTLHGPEGSEPLVGEGTGFVLSGEGLPKVYVSGDNASLDRVRKFADREGPFDVALLFAGAARTPLVPDASLTSEQAAEAATVLGARHVVPLHFEHWGHFTQDGPAAPAGARGVRTTPTSAMIRSEAATVQGADRRRDFV